ncbi:hypothetical protein Tco_1563121 [Tanacetum coccineum]
MVTTIADRIRGFVIHLAAVVVLGIFLFAWFNMKSGFLDSGWRRGGHTKEKTKETNVSNSGANSTDLKVGNMIDWDRFITLGDDGTTIKPFNEALTIDDVSGTSNDTNKGMQVDDFGEKLMVTFGVQLLMCLILIETKLKVTSCSYYANF